MSLLSSILTVAKAVTERFVPGVKQYEDAAQGVLDIVKTVRSQLSSEDQVALDAALPDILLKMNRNVDQAIKDARGE